MDVMVLVNQVQAAAKNVRDHRHMVAALASRINALQGLILSLVEDGGQACPFEFLERLQVRPTKSFRQGLTNDPAALAVVSGSMFTVIF